MRVVKSAPPQSPAARRLTRRRQSRKVRLVQQDGRFIIPGLDAWYSHWRDPYHLLLTIPWPGFAALVAVTYILLNALFAGLYLLEPDNLTGARPGSFEDAFFFSVHTLASIGYGVIAPKTTYSNILVTIEAILSLLLIAVVTGISFARFSKPVPKLIFSKYAVVTPHEGIPTLMLRAANQRRNFISEAQAKLYLSRDEITLEGVRLRRVYDLKLVREVNPSFSLTWSLMHPIDENSPLYGLDADSWLDGLPSLIVSMSGLDSTVSYTISVRHTYGTNELLWAHRLADVIHMDDQGDRYVDYQYFDHVIPLVSDRE
jgi:inward rectifier potassium channel